MLNYQRLKIHVKSQTFLHPFRTYHSLRNLIQGKGASRRRRPLVLTVFFWVQMWGKTMGKPWQNWLVQWETLAKLWKTDGKKNGDAKSNSGLNQRGLDSLDQPTWGFMNMWPTWISPSLFPTKNLATWWITRHSHGDEAAQSRPWFIQQMNSMVTILYGKMGKWRNRCILWSNDCGSPILEYYIYMYYI